MGSWRSAIHGALRRTPARYWYHRAKSLLGGGSQSDEARILFELSRHCPKTFVEFGFHPTQYNCIALKDFNGLVVDGDSDTVRLGRAILPKRIQVRHQFLALDNLAAVTHRFDQLGVLSIDVDGNDYWFLQAAVTARPHVICVEYNASLLAASITVPYAAAFDRHQAHPSGWYHGASLEALVRLCERSGYQLVAVAAAGANAFFMRQDLAPTRLSAAGAYRENLLRNKWSSTGAAEQWARIQHLPFVEVE
jgi:hypothetical protein